MVNFSDMNLTLQMETEELHISEDLVLNVKTYLPINDKADFIQFIVTGSLDSMTGCFSPVRTEVYYAIGLCKWYAGIELTEDELADAAALYDILETNNLIRAIESCIPAEELDILHALINDTLDDITRYNNSAAGIIQAMSNNADGLDGQLASILEQIKNSEGLEQLSVIKDVVGNE